MPATMNNKASTEKSAEAKAALQAQTNSGFAETLANRYWDASALKGQKPNFADLIKYCLVHGIIEERTACNYMALDKYWDMVTMAGMPKTEAVGIISESLPQSERTVWGWMQKTRRYFRNKSVKFLDK